MRSPRFRSILIGLAVCLGDRAASAQTSGVRHITQQFQAWTLACTETVATHAKSCGVSQDIFGPGGALAFHWELADASGDHAKMTIMLAPLLANSVIVLRSGSQSIVVDTLKCSATGCVGSAYLPGQSLTALAAGGPVTAQFIYMNATGSVIALAGSGFREAWKAMREEAPVHEMMTGSLSPRHAPTPAERVEAASHFR